MQRASGINTDSISSSGGCAILELSERADSFNHQRQPQPFAEDVSSRSIEILEVLNTMFNNLELQGASPQSPAEKDG